MEFLALNESMFTISGSGGLQATSGADLFSYLDIKNNFI
jgi:hypothetical protein